jgi:hypothetical protein
MTAVRCALCRRYHEQPVCAECGTPLENLHSLVALCHACKAIARQARRAARK